MATASQQNRLAVEATVSQKTRINTLPLMIDSVSVVTVNILSRS
ncbi:hypothetical protein [Dickeya fangzhongdai]|nr:hypothetical protein [Dickeya fangzhongdai]